MAVEHQAFLFDPAALVADLVARTVVDGEFRLERLRARATEIVKAASPELASRLERLRYDGDWLGERSAAEQFVIALAAVVTPSPSLSGGDRYGWDTLRRVLPAAGWDTDSVDELVRGHSLETLLRSTRLEPLIAAAPYLWQFGGWLDVGAARALLRRLERAPEALPDAARPAAAAARAMLAAADDSGNALFLTLD